MRNESSNAVFFYTGRFTSSHHLSLFYIVHQRGKTVHMVHNLQVLLLLLWMSFFSISLPKTRWQKHIYLAFALLLRTYYDSCKEKKLMKKWTVQNWDHQETHNTNQLCFLLLLLPARRDWEKERKTIIKLPWPVWATVRTSSIVKRDDLAWNIAMRLRRENRRG